MLTLGAEAGTPGKLGVGIAEFAAETFEAAEAAFVAVLATHKFGVLWRLDAKNILKTRIDVSVAWWLRGARCQSAITL